MLGVVEHVAMKWYVYFAVAALGIAAFVCSKHSQPQPQASAIHISASPPGAEPYLFMLILTNSQPPPMRSLIAITKRMKYEWHKTGSDGSQSTVKGDIPPQIFYAVMAEWRKMSARS